MKITGLVTITRQLTGAPYHRGYAFNVETRRIVSACRHNHRTSHAARLCAGRLVRAALRAAREER